MSGVREGSATPNMKGYSMHSEGSETKSRRALSSDGHLVRAGLWLGRAFVVARGVRAWSRGGYEEEAPVREVGERTHCVLLAHGR